MGKVWTYVLGKPLESQVLDRLQKKGDEFVNSWTAHENSLSATFDIFGNRILVVKVNESVHGASGCSIDKLNRFIKECSAELGTDLLDRMQVAYDSPEGIQVVKAARIPELIQSGAIGAETPVYNTAVSSEQELQNWKQPLKKTWLKKYLAAV